VGPSWQETVEAEPEALEARLTGVLALLVPMVFLVAVVVAARAQLLVEIVLQTQLLVQRPLPEEAPAVTELAAVTGMVTWVVCQAAEVAVAGQVVHKEMEERVVAARL